MRRLGLGILAVWVLTPVLTLAVASFSRVWRYPALVPQELTARAWRALVDSAVGGALLTSAAIAAVVALLATAIGFAAARALAWHRVRGRALVELLIVAPLLIPPFAAVMGVQVVFIRAGLGDTAAGVVLAHLIPAVPYTTLLLRAAVSTVDPGLEAQARTLGAGPVGALVHVTLPALRPALLAAAGFAFLISWSEYLMTVIVGGGAVSTWPTLLFATATGSGTSADTAALALAGLAPPVLLLLLSGALARTGRTK